MRRIPVRIAFALLAALAASAVAANDEEGKPLVDGDDPAQFELVGFDARTITLKDGEIRLSGKPDGYFSTKSSYHNYILKFEWMYERPADLKSDARFEGNSGVLIHLVGAHKVWPQCIEVQLYNKDPGNIFAINGSKFTGKKDESAQKKAIKPVGEWNRETITCKDGAITCEINGVEVARGTGASPDAGKIAFQAEGKPIRFRKMRIKTLD